jgi:hypothetical protein
VNAAGSSSTTSSSGRGGAPGGPVQLGLFFGPARSFDPEPAPASSGPAVAVPAELTPPAPARSSSSSDSKRMTAAAVGPPVRPGRGGWIQRWQVASGTEANVVHVVAQRADGSVGCSCKGWIYHASRPRCRHIEAVFGPAPSDDGDAGGAA